MNGCSPRKVVVIDVDGASTGKPGDGLLRGCESATERRAEGELPPLVHSYIYALRTSDTMSSESAVSSTEIEHELALLWQEVLNIDPVPGPADDFFSLGGDSVAMITTELRIRETFSVDLPDGAMLRVSSLRELSQLIERCRFLDGVHPQ